MLLQRLHEPTHLHRCDDGGRRLHVGHRFGLTPGCGNASVRVSAGRGTSQRFDHVLDHAVRESLEKELMGLIGETHPKFAVS